DRQSLLARAPLAVGPHVGGAKRHGVRHPGGDHLGLVLYLGPGLLHPGRAHGVFAVWADLWIDVARTGLVRVAADWEHSAAFQTLRVSGATHRRSRLQLSAAGR